MPDYKSVVVSTTDKKKNKKKKKENAALAIVKGLIPWKGDSVGEIIRKIVFLVSIVALCVAVLIIIDKYMFEPERQRNEYQSSILQLGNHEPTAEEIAELPEKAINTEYAPFYAINNDFVGWLSIKGINVNYPVVQGKNNTDYLEKDFYGNYSKNGTIFADYENEFKNTGETSANTILYGHNLRTENFFAEITEYRRVDLDKSLEFLKEHPVIEFNTLYEKAKYKIFSVMLINTREEYGDVFNYPALLNFANRDEFNYFTSECLDRSEFFTGVDMKYGDKFLIGAGTVTDEATAAAAKRAGAKFILTPAVDEGVIGYCVNEGLTVIPGVMTPTEILTAVRAGAKAVKLFPASVFPPRIISDLRAPFGGLQVLASAGITEDNAKEWLKAGAFALAVSSPLLKGAKENDFAAVKSNAERFVRLVNEK